MKYNIKRIKIKEKKISGRKRYILGILIFVFISFSVFVTIQGVTTGNELSELETKARKLSEENKKLSKKLIEPSSLHNKASLAEDLGFEKPSEIVYLDGDVSVASLR
jgi:cell division protein FtsL